MNMEKFVNACDLFLRRINNYIDLIFSIFKKNLKNVFLQYISLIIIMFITIFYKVRNYKGIEDAVIIGLLLFTISLLLLAFGKTYYSLKKQKFEINLCKVETLQDSSIDESNVVTYLQASDESVKSLFEHLKDNNFFDTTLIKEKNHMNNIEPTEVFKFEYFKEFINDIRFNGETIKRLYLIADQKTVGFLIFDVFKPIMKRDVTKILDYFYYYQYKNGFKPINYDSINSRSKRSIHPQTQKFLPDFFLKFRSDL